MDFRHTFTVILPSVTRTLNNSNLPLTRNNFCFPTGHFLYNFTLDNSNHACQDVTNKVNCSPKLTLNLFLIIEAGFVFFALFCIRNTCQSSSSSQYLVFSCCYALLSFMLRYVLINNLEILIHFHSTSLLLNLITMYTL